MFITFTQYVGVAATATGVVELAHVPNLMIFHTLSCRCDRYIGCGIGLCGKCPLTSVFCNAISLT